MAAFLSKGRLMKGEIVVIGGGLGGLSAAIHLASAGLPVRLIEQRPTLGGKAGEIRREGFRWDTGPSVLTLPFILEQIFTSSGESLSDYLTLLPVSPLTEYRFPDGRRLRLWRDPERMRAELDRWGPELWHRWERFLRYARRLYENAAPLFLETPIHSLSHLLRQPAFWRIRNLLLPIDPFRSMHAAAQKYLRDPALVQIADRYATYNGSDPFRAPATLNLISWVENGLGVYYIQGGIYRLVEALTTLAQKKGVIIHTEEKVLALHHSRGRIQAVETDKATYPAQAVVSAVDVRLTYERLLRSPLPYLLRRNEPSLSGIVFLWGVQIQSDMGHHTIFFSRDYRQEFEEIFRKKELPSDPTIYVAITSKTDAAHAPIGAENWFILVNAPPSSGPWKPQMTEKLRQHLYERFAQNIPGFSSAKVVVEEVLTPDYWESLGSVYGSLYGSASNGLFSAFLRPANRSRRFRGLYFAGGAAHPGGGIPLVLLSGRHAAQLLIEDWQGK